MNSWLRGGGQLVSACACVCVCVFAGGGRGLRGKKMVGHNRSGEEGVNWEEMVFAQVAERKPRFTYHFKYGDLRMRLTALSY